MTRVGCTAATVLLLLAAAGRGSSQQRQAQTGGARQLIDLRDIGQLRSLFNARSVDLATSSGTPTTPSPQAPSGGPTVGRQQLGSSRRESPGREVR
jgi:hypothetical protein